MFNNLPYERDTIKKEEIPHEIVIIAILIISIIAIIILVNNDYIKTKSELIETKLDKIFPDTRIIHIEEKTTITTINETEVAKTNSTSFF